MNNGETLHLIDLGDDEFTDADITVEKEGDNFIHLSVTTSEHKTTRVIISVSMLRRISSYLDVS